MTAQKRNGPAAGNDKPAKDNTKTDGPNSIANRFKGTDNPRYLRALQALRVRPVPREQLDRVAGCSNGPELIAQLRRDGLEIPCTRTRKKDRDMFDCWPGVYSLTQADRRKLNAWLARRAGGDRASN